MTIGPKKIPEVKPWQDLRIFRIDVFNHEDTTFEGVIKEIMTIRPPKKIPEVTRFPLST